VHAKPKTTLFTVEECWEWVCHCT